ncbi:MAG: regulator of sigma protease [Epulopiscium sp.]|jgi:regulator of sigma E protease|uniref:RIP metalloprotease RseP n=1 Tax=Defluviitalea raffinosedens TaxID=1450156 RepID=UPI00195A1F38|nr:RIP metalloprotease RseP [Defluviitalea raffinosedens]MBM7685167.1 regulator of sigma E protease [Defluviitalea raffinosedens]MBZ4668581.1 putative rane-associated zinc metalloprotease [Defluviitaleaceae bacterium]MDK2787187.1 regulator of sigma protease [Candidatus Epulonipiscium sp.]
MGKRIYERAVSFLTILIALLVFGIIVLVHEFGHYAVAKKSGVKVEEFAIGMGPKLISKQYGETLYSIRILPMGGFCKMLGEDSASEDKRSFTNKSVGTRIAVIFAGPFMNLVLAFVIIAWFVGSNGYITTRIDHVLPDTPAASIGLQPGDKIISLDGQRIHIRQEISLILSQVKDHPIEIIASRDGEKITKVITPVIDEKTNQGFLGISFESKEQGEATILEILGQSLWQVVFLVKQVVLGFIQIITGQVSRQQIAGPVGVIQIIGESYESGLKTSFYIAIQNVLYFAAIISANLGVMNLLPIPALDGGRLVFLIIEGLRGKPIAVEKEGMIHFIGFALLMVLMVFVLYNDVVRIITH